MKIKLLLLASLSIATITIFQEQSQSIWQQILEILNSSYVSAGLFTASILEATELVKAKFKLKDQLAKNASWFVGVGLALAGKLFNYGIFAGQSWLWTGIVTLIGTFSAQGLFGYDFIRLFLNFLTPKTHQVKPKSA